uniref:Uncharacterized protein n=1 Tax=Tanacetum cinerariifolium TaxID=118510 RepID=A0A699KWZ3_TANCI|nr:hypothetical protein [Tanacetum cinerariifolium]
MMGSDTLLWVKTACTWRGNALKKVFAAMEGSGTLLSPKQHFTLPIEFLDVMRNAAIAFYLAVMILRLCSVAADGGRMAGCENCSPQQPPRARRQCQLI